LPVELRAAWYSWEAVADRANPQTAPRILSTAPIKRVVDFALAECPRALVWYEHQAESSILKSLGVKIVALDKDPDPTHKGLQAISIDAHRDGRNLQAFNSNVVLQPPANGEAWQQLLGRTHRPGQLADEVSCFVCAHTPEFVKAIDRACKDATFAESMTGERQRLLQAEWAQERFL